jgi:phosphatidylglycerol lysyltransferase
MYGVQGRSWVAMGDPVGPQRSWPELIWSFREQSDRFGGWALFYQVAPDGLPYYVDLGLTLAWLDAKNTREKSFSLGSFRREYLGYFDIAVVKKADKIVAFANLWKGGDMAELSIDLMRYDPAAVPGGVMEYLFIQLMLWGKEQGVGWFDLGMAPLSGLDDRSLAPLWNRLGGFLSRHGGHFYNFEGLRQYKDKFDPVWEPRYLASPGGLALPVILTHLAQLISGGLKGTVTK